MKKEFTSILIFICLVLFGFLVSAEMTPNSPDGYNYDVRVFLNQGWNLVLAFDLKDLSPSSDIKSEDIVVTWMYSSDDKRYWQFYPDKSEFDSSYSENKVSEFSDKASRIMFGSMWIYSKRAGYLAYNRVDVPKINEVTLLQGWNFMTTTSDMVGKNMGDIKGSCDIEKVFAYVSGNWRNWFDKTGEKNNLDVMFIPTENAGTGFIMKVSSDCVLGSLSSSVNPPSLPDTSVQCVETDSGKDYAKKGTTKGMTILFVSEINGTRTPVYSEDTDVCHKDNQAVADEGLFEYYCENNQIKVTAGENMYLCPNKCEDGACI